MEEKTNMSDLTTQERLALIRKATKKFQKKQNRQSRVKRTENSQYMNIVRNEFDNINHYTDDSRYADQYYGDAFRNTTRYDNDWD